jgi:hypothetical protein
VRDQAIPSDLATMLRRASLHERNAALNVARNLRHREDRHLDLILGPRRNPVLAYRIEEADDFASLSPPSQRM